MLPTNTIGPLGFIQPDDAAIITDALLKKAAAPYQRAPILGKAIETGRRSDISWISTETPDRYNHVVITAGMDNSAYQLNPIVTNNHNYEIPPIGRSSWQRPGTRKGLPGIQAQTHYPERPDDLQGEWAPDLIFAQICAGILNAKSIGFIPLQIREHNDQLIIEKWALIEYAVGTIGINPDATVIQINKTLPQPPPPRPATTTWPSRSRNNSTPWTPTNSFRISLTDSAASYSLHPKEHP